MFHWLEKNYQSLLVQGIWLGSTYLLVPHASANPNSDFSCESLTPITNTVQPEELSGDEDGQTPSDMKVVPLPTPPTLPTLPTLSSQELATSFCAADLTGATEATPETQAPPEETSTPEVAPETEAEVESEPVENKDGWRINIQPYATIPVTTYGEVTVKGKSVSYHQNLGELLEVLKVAVSGRIEAWIWARGDASGFGLAGEENLSWNAIFGADWWVRPNLSLQLAYRFYSIKYGNGSGDNAFLFEENFNRPYLSATFRF